MDRKHHPTADPQLIGVDKSQAHWRTVRRYLNRHRHELAQVAARLYPDLERVASTALLTTAGWLPSHPVAFDSIALAWIPEAPAGATDGMEPESRLARPLQAHGVRYRTYVEALAALDPPQLLENRSSYRLMSVDWSERGQGRLVFGQGAYFDVINICEAAAHELTAAWLDLPAHAPGRPSPTTNPTQLHGRLLFRERIGDPFDLRHRPVLPAISTLTLRRDASGAATFLLHWRDPAKVASGGGLYQVVPVGLFQPSADTPEDEANDFDLWRNVVREFSEELLGTPEHDGSRSTPIDYDSWPLYQTLDQAQTTGKLHVFCLGLGVDPLTLATDILTVAVFEGDVFDQVFGELVAVNEEGPIVTASDGIAARSGIPFTQENIDRFADGEPMQPAGAALLQLAWRHRNVLLQTT